MTLVRYVGPLAAYRGAIGFAADGGARIGGRVRLGDVAPARYDVVNGVDEVLGVKATWSDACALIASLSGQPVDVPPDPAGLEMAVGESVYRLEVV